MQSAVRPFTVAIGGPTCAGKSTLAQAVLRALGPARAVILPLDSYYRDLSALDPAARSARNFDEPTAMDWPLFIDHLDALRSGQPVPMPVYDFTLHTRLHRTVLVQPQDFIIVEGLLALHMEDVRVRCNLKIYVDAGDETSFSRRRDRDVIERGRSPESIRRQYRESVEPMARRYVFPSRAFADLVLDGNADSRVSVETILNRIAELIPLEDGKVHPSR